jgi:hypothetical protein
MCKKALDVGLCMTVASSHALISLKARAQAAFFDSDFLQRYHLLRKTRINAVRLVILKNRKAKSLHIGAAKGKSKKPKNV